MTMNQSFRYKGMQFSIYTKAVAQRCSVKNVFLEISQNSQKNTCARVSFLVKLQAWDLRPKSLAAWF